MRTVGCIIARTVSMRLPKKVLREINGKKMIEYIIEKMKHTRNLDDLYLCTSVDEKDKILLDVAKENNIKGYAGSRSSVIDRMLDVAEIENADNVVRITGDNVFTDEFFLERMIELHEDDPAVEYTRTEYLAQGVTSEVIKVSALKRCYEMMDPDQSEYLMGFIFDSEKFNCRVLIPEKALQAEFCNLSVDTPADLERTQFLVDQLYKNGRIYYDDIIKLSKQMEIPHFEIDKDAPIKIPDNKTITYYEIRKKTMHPRIEKAQKIYLEDGFYENQRNS